MGGGTGAAVKHHFEQVDVCSLERTNPQNHLSHFDGDEQDRPGSESRYVNKENISFNQSMRTANDGVVNPPAIINGRNIGTSDSRQEGPNKSKSFTLGHGQQMVGSSTSAPGRDGYQSVQAGYKSGLSRQVP
jgi:hypothetical protein